LTASRQRFAPLDAVRGIAMVLMTLDHASSAFNSGRISSDGASRFVAGSVLEPAQFAARWIAHVCAPAFLLLAGAALALAVARRRASRETEAAIDRWLAIRGAILLALEVVWMSWVVAIITSGFSGGRYAWYHIHLEVLFAIGASLLAMIALRRLPPRAVGLLGVALLIGLEATHAFDAAGPTTRLLAGALVTGDRYPHVTILYPVLPWLAFLLIGWALGAELAEGRTIGARGWLVLAAIALLVFLAVRGANGFGNAGLYREDGSLIQWLHVSKYPPSLTFAGLELAVVFLLLAGASLWSPRPLVVLGETALFFYVLHIHLLRAAASALGVHRECGLGGVLIAWVAALTMLYPLCAWYGRLKARRPDSALRWL
jgi:uncharacterized membrane protein